MFFLAGFLFAYFLFAYFLFAYFLFTYFLFCSVCCLPNLSGNFFLSCCPIFISDFLRRGRKIFLQPQTASLLGAHISTQFKKKSMLS
jgi:hypothetical protein